MSDRTNPQESSSVLITLATKAALTRGMELCLASVATNNEESHLHYRHFFIARDSESGKALGTSALYITPSGLYSTLLSLKTSVSATWDEAFYIAAMKRLQFFFDEDAWCKLPEMNTCSFVETMFVDSTARGKGVGQALLEKCIDKAVSEIKPNSTKLQGEGVVIDNMFLMCALGNASARKVYEKGGFRVIGQFKHAQCAKLMGTDGFDIFIKKI